MLTFAFLSTLLILSDIRIVGNSLNSSGLPASAIKNAYQRTSHMEPFFYVDFVQSQRRLLEHPRIARQTYRNHDYNFVRRHRRSRNKFDEERSYRSSVKNNEDEDEEDEEEEEEEEEENQGDEEDRLEDNEDVDEETADQEETVARNRMARSGYVPFESEAGERERREVVRIRSVTEDCEGESTEPSQYYEYETEVRNAASQNARELQATFIVFSASLLIFLFT